MFVTNLTNAKLGINGVINLAPREVNRYIDNDNEDLVSRVLRLEAAKLVSVVREEGLTKVNIPGKVTTKKANASKPTPAVEKVEVKETKPVPTESEGQAATKVRARRTAKAKVETTETTPETRTENE